MLKETLKSWMLLPQGRTQWATWGVLTASLATIAIVSQVSINLKNLLSNWGDHIQFQIYLDDKCTETNRNNILSQLHIFQNVDQVEYISKEQATKLFKSQVKSLAPDLLTDNEFANPFPASFKVSLIKNSIPTENLDIELQKMSDTISKWEGVEDISYGQNWIRNYSEFVSALTSIGGMIALILLFCNLFVVANAIRMSIAARQEEIEILELVGATQHAIRWPFLIEGARLGFWAATMAGFINAALAEYMLSGLENSPHLGRILPSLQMVSWKESLVLLVVGSLVGGIGAYLAAAQLNTGWLASNTISTRSSSKKHKNHFISFSFIFFFSLMLIGQTLTAWSMSNALAFDDKAQPPEHQLIGREGGGGELLNDIAEQIHKTQATASLAEKEKRILLGSLFGIQRKIKKISLEKGHLTDELLQAQVQASNLADTVQKLEEKILQERLMLRKRLRSVYKLSGESFIGLLFSTQYSTEWDQTLKFLKILNDSDYKLLRTYQKNILAYRKQKDRYQNQAQKLTQIEKKIASQEKLLTAEHAEKSKIVSQLEGQKNQALSQIQILKGKAKESLKDKDKTIADNYSSAWSDLLRPSFFEHKGRIPSPLPEALLKRNFGAKRDQRNGVVLTHKGWSLEASDNGNNKIYNIFEGHVALVQELPGYGKTMIIDHGDHYYSVYAPLFDVNLKVGDLVQQSQIIGQLKGKSSKLTSGNQIPALYFEIRHFSEAQDPGQWLAPQKNEINLKSEYRLQGKVDL